ncbi:NADP-dependent oxidoreductase [Nocardiopsis flavescens]
MGAANFRTAVVRVPGGPDSIEFIELPVREPGPGEVRVAVTAAPVNPVDLGVAGGVFHEAGIITQTERTGLGWDFAGTVAAVGEGANLAVGTRVAGLVGGLDRDFGTYAEQLVVPAANVAEVPEGLEPAEAATLPLNGLTAAQIVDLVGGAPEEGDRLLVTGAAGSVGGYVLTLARERGWRVTGLARAGDEGFVRGLGADFTDRAAGVWDAVADTAALREDALGLVRDGGVFVGVQPGFPVASERGIDVRTVGVVPDGVRLAGLLARAAAGELAPRVHAVVPLAEAAEAHRAFAKGGVRGRYVLQP